MKPFLAADIRLRMLQPHELSAAHSFGAEYRFAGNKGDQIRQIGNSWPCKLGEALAGVLLDEYVQPQRSRLVRSA